MHAGGPRGTRAWCAHCPATPPYTTLPHTGVESFRVALGTTAGQDDLVAWAPRQWSTSMLLPDLRARVTWPVHVTVSCRNGAGGETNLTLAFIVDATPPTFGDGALRSMQSHTPGYASSTPVLRWDASLVTDMQTPVTNLSLIVVDAQLKPARLPNEGSLFLELRNLPLCCRGSSAQAQGGCQPAESLQALKPHLRLLSLTHPFTDLLNHTYHHPHPRPTRCSPLHVAVRSPSQYPFPRTPASSVTELLTAHRPFTRLQMSANSAAAHTVPAKLRPVHEEALNISAGAWGLFDFAALSVTSVGCLLAEELQCT